MIDFRNSRYVIVDISLDRELNDVLALLYLLSNHLINVSLIAVSRGDVDYTCRLIAKILTILHREEIPIAKGSADSNDFRPLEEWVGSFSLDNFAGVIFNSYHSAFEDVLCQGIHPTILEFGSFRSLLKVEKIIKSYHLPIVVGGSLSGTQENDDFKEPEQILMSDPDSAAYFINDPGIEITIVPPHLMRTPTMKEEDLKVLLNIKTPLRQIIDELPFSLHMTKKQLPSLPLSSLTLAWYLFSPENFAIRERCVYLEKNGFLSFKGKRKIYFVTEIHKINVMVRLTLDIFSTKRDESHGLLKIGIEGRYMVMYTNKIVNNQLSVFEVGWEQRKPGAYYGPAIRDFYIMHFVTKGKGILNVAGKKYEFAKGICFLVPPQVMTYYESDREDPCQYYWVGFGGAEAKELCMKCGFIIDNKYTIKPLNFSASIERLRIMNAISLQSPANSYILLGNLYLLLAETMKDMGIVQNEKADYVGQAIAYFDANYDKSVGVGDAAKAVGIERSHLFRLFKEKTGLSPKEYLIDMRIEKSKSLLANSNASVEFIASSVGYSNYPAFVAAFTKKTSLTPTQYRKRRSNNRKLLGESR